MLAAYTLKNMPNSNLTSPEDGFVKLELRTAYGPVFRDVSTNPARDARSDEIPVIDISNITGNLQQKQSLAQIIKRASENTGFFYIKNHGIPAGVVEEAQEAAKSFFKQPLEKKLEASKSKSRYFNGYFARGTGKASPSEGSKLTRLMIYLPG